MMHALSHRPLRNALLFGGALLAASASAQASITLTTSVTLDGNSIFNQNRLDAYVSNTNITNIQPGEGYYGHLDVQTHQKWTGSAFSFAPYGSSIQWSAFSSTGFSMTASAGPNGNAFSYSMSIWFVVESTGTYRLTSGAGGQLNFWHYGGTAEAPTVAGTTGIDLNDPFSSYDGTFVLERGLHRLDTNGGVAQGDPAATRFVTFQQVPAPGAAALLGVAGLARSRRRR